MAQRIFYLLAMIKRTFAALALLYMLLPSADRSIRIEYPNGGEVLKRGTQVAVRWSTQGIEGNLALLLFKNGEQLAIIAAGIPDNGLFQWTVATSLPEATGYRLRLCSLNDLRINDFSDGDFSISK